MRFLQIKKSYKKPYFRAVFLKNVKIIDRLNDQYCSYTAYFFLTFNSSMFNSDFMV